jgi:acetyl-CoA carboxylase carboxyl transferase subunit alpha
MASHVLPFEKPLAELLDRVAKLRAQLGTDPSLRHELERVEAQAAVVARMLFSELTPWQKVQLSRHPKRPYTLDYVSYLFEDFVELQGDRRFANDASIVAGLGRFRGRSVVLVGHQKGRTSKENVKRNFGMANPEGYRKADRLYTLADRFRLPILAFVDTPGAYPGIGAEERGQSEAIGACLATLSRVGVPVITTITGEGGSGGALALAVANRVHVLEYGTYSVISPEGCASILWKDGAKSAEAAERMRMTAPELLKLGVVDRIVNEPAGGAHRDHPACAKLVGDAIEDALRELEPLTRDQLIDDRYARFRRLGAVKVGT